MKKYVAPIMALLCVVTVSACSTTKPNDDVYTTAPLETITLPESVHFFMPDGTPMMALSSLLDSGIVVDGTEVGMQTTLVKPTEVGTIFTTYPECDFAIMPTVTAVQLLNKGLDISYVSANVFGNLYLVGVGGAESLSDLVGKVVYTTTGTTIALLQYELKANGISYETGSEAKDGVVTIWSMDEASSYIPLIKQAQTKGTEAYGVLGEPAVTKCMGMVSEAKIVVDMQKEYEKLTKDSGYPQACLVVRNTFANAYPDFVKLLVSKMEENKAYTTSHASELKALYEKAGSTALTGIDFTADTVSRCNLGVLTGDKLVSSVQNYIDSMRSYVPALATAEVKDSFFIK